MSIASLAQTARQSLARGLEALQTRDAPEGLLDVAEPVAYAIGGLVDLELTSGPVSALSVEPVLDALRESLRLLQSPELAAHPAAARSMKAIAEAFSNVVSLMRYIRAGEPIAGPFSMSAAATSVRASVCQDGMLPAGPFLAPPPTNARMVRMPSTPSPAPVVSNALPPESTLLGAVPMIGARSSAPTEGALTSAPPVGVPAPSLAKAASSVVASAAVAAPSQSVPAPARTVAVPSSAVASMRPSIRSLSAPGTGHEPTVTTRMVNVAAASESTLRADAGASLRAVPASLRIGPTLTPPEPPRTAPTPPPIISVRPSPLAETGDQKPSRAPVAIRREVVVERDLRAVDAPLGAHSPSNFYRGLAGGDVVASGGLFVATYQAPRVGEKVLLKISMPGGYEFVAKASVAWTRDATPTLGAGSGRGVVTAPGFGAEFCELTDEGRRLIQRYVRNREPLFHENSP